MSKRRIFFGDIARRITGFTLPVFGVSWNPPESERKVVREVLIFLEDRRALYNDFAHEINHEVAESVLAIRQELTGALKRLPDSSAAVPCLRAMRAACREYLDTARSTHSTGYFSFLTELGKLRAMIGVQVAYLAVKYGFDVEGELARIIPPELRNAKFLKD